MSKPKTFTSARKLDSLPVGSRVTWSSDMVHPKHIHVWTKITTCRGKTGWCGGDSLTMLCPHDAKTALGYNANRPFRVVSVPSDV